jgi:hypothetical protein
MVHYPKMISNPARRTMWIWVFVTLVFIFGIFAPSSLGIEGMHGGYAISFFSIILAITGIVVVIIYIGRSRSLDNMLRQKNVLVRWTYSPKEWQAFTEKAYSAEKSERWKLYCLVMAIACVVCLGFWLFNRDSGMLMIFIVLGLAAILAATVLITTGFDRWQNKKHSEGVYITRDGALINRTLHLWHGWGARLEAVRYKEQDCIIEIKYVTPSRTGWNTYTVRVPVPDGEEEKARQVAIKLEQIN